MDQNPTVRLSDGVEMPLIGLGTLNFKPDDKTFKLNDHIMNAAKAGYMHFDINPSQPNVEQALGQALRLVLQAKTQMQDEQGQKIPDQFVKAYPRQNLFISYKVNNTPDIVKSVKAALQNLKLQYFDLVMLNCPTSPPPPQPAQNPDGQPPKQQQQVKPKKISMFQAWKCLEQCKKANLCRSIGVSNFTMMALINLHPFVNIKPTVNQVESHPFLPMKNMHALCKKLKVTMIAYCPLMRGGKDQKQPLGDKIDYMADPILKQLSQKYAKSIPQVILNYQICRQVAVIPKTQKLDHLNENFNITDFEVMGQDVEKLQSLDKGGKLKVYQLKNLPLWKGEDPLC